jgi:4-hydroxy-tetrahydrodipicolinate reductase
MGQVLGAGLSLAPDLSIVTLVDVQAPSELFGSTYAPRLSDVDALGIDVVIDFANPESVVTSAGWCAANGVGLVVGATGLTTEQRGSVEQASRKTGVIMATNFSIGAVLAERFASMAAPYFERVEIIELHHDKKVDAPSGTSITTARAIADARRRAGLAPMSDPTSRFTLAGARGADAGDGVMVHAVRLPGLVAHQEVIFGGPGEGLTIRHDSFDRNSFVQGVALAVRAVTSAPGLTIGIGSFVK